MFSFIVRTVAAAWRRLATDRGQSTAEYALVVLGAAAVAFIFITWAGGTDTITRLFDSVMDSVIGRIT